MKDLDRSTVCAIYFSEGSREKFYTYISHNPNTFPLSKQHRQTISIRPPTKPLAYYQTQYNVYKLTKS